MSVSPIGQTPIVIGGKTYTPPTTTRNPDGTWSSTPAKGMADFMKTNNREVKNTFDGETFLKLLVAQLRYQDPTKPADTGQLMQQTATLSMVERINEMATSAEAMVKASEALAKSNETMSASYAAMLSQQRVSSAVQFVGRTVTYQDAANPGSTVEGVVDSVRFDDSGPILVIGGKDVPLASVGSVKAPPSSGSTGTSTPPAGSTTNP